jgi:DNA-binding winged helix-turn-helix (wHTH) protein
MFPNARAQHVVRFGLFELNLSTVELCKQGRKIKLQDQPFQVLRLLVKRPNDVVTREEVQKALWPADTFVEFDQGLNTAIKKIRQALDDSAENPRFIETIPRKGYRFIAPVSGLETFAPTPAPRPRLIWPASALLLMVVAGFGGWLLNNRAKTADAPLVPVPLTSYTGDECCPSFSPDGNQVVFQWRQLGQDHVDIYVKLVGASEPLRLTNGPADSYCPTWSPDGRSIAFLRILSNAKRGLFFDITPRRTRAQVKRGGTRLLFFLWGLASQRQVPDRN